MGVCCSHETKTGELPSAHPISQPVVLVEVAPAKQELEYNDHQNQIVRIQTGIRKANAKKRVKREKAEAEKERPGDLWKPTKEPRLEDLSPRVQEVMRERGKFRFDKPLPEEFKDCRFFTAHENAKAGNIYVGQWLNQLRHGRGKQYFADGAIYEGYWKNDMASGRGRLIHSNGDVYEGSWHKNKADGRGVYINYNDKAEYNGEWSNDLKVCKNGYGVEKALDGTTFEGNFVNGKKQGKGKCVFPSGDSYTGEFYDDAIQGEGKYCFADGRVYEGEFMNNKMHGQGHFRWTDGREYIGEYKDDHKHGEGEFIWADGTRYKGQFRNGKQDGKGMLTDRNGQKNESEWSEGREVKK